MVKPDMGRSNNGLKSASLFCLIGSAVAASSSSDVTIQDAVPAGYVAAPYYPSPYGGWDDDWTESYGKAIDLVSQMTLAEKTNITAGTGMYMGIRCIGNTGSALRVGFPQLCLSDGPLGIRATDNNTAFPAAITTGATFNKQLMYERGVALGEEFRGKGSNVYLGPSVGPLGRKGLGGRNWEGFGADPVLQAIAGAETVRGVQEQGVMATIKHLIGNEQEMYRMYNPVQAAYSSNIDDRTLHELYLWPFAEGIRAGAVSAMASYNDVNGSLANQNAYLINNLLKDELGFQGFIMTDWLAQLSGVGSALAGLDMSMPGDTIANNVPLFGYSHWMYQLTISVLNGSVPVERLNDMTTRIVAAWYKMGQDQDFPEPNFSANAAGTTGALYPGAGLQSPQGLINEHVDVQGNHKVVAKQVAQEAITMVKNSDSYLPFTSSSVKMSVFGTDARADPDGINSCTDKTCNNGYLGMGWGSGTANYPYIDDPLSSLKRRVGNVTYYETDSYPSSGVPTPSADDVAVVFINSDSGENSYTVESNHGDRDADGYAAWHDGDSLVQDVADVFSNVVVVYHTVGPVIVEPWIDLPSVKSVFIAHLPGQEGGDSLTEVLFGDVSPSGHLPYAIPVSADDYPESVHLQGPAIKIGQLQETFTEGLYIDYRYLQKNGIAPRYPFGFGLSYADFGFSDATITPVTELTSTPPARPSKPATAVANMNFTIPAAAEAYKPSGFSKLWRYLYSWPTNSEADAAYAVGQDPDQTYPYPEGYSEEQKPGPPAGGPSGGNPALWDVAFNVSVTVTNNNNNNAEDDDAAGAAASGKAVAQAYLQYPDQGDNGGFDTPPLQLRDFAKTTEALAPGETATLTLTLTRKDFSVWDAESQNWVIPSPEGRYGIWVGESSGDLGLVCWTDTLTCEEGAESPV